MTEALAKYPYALHPQLNIHDGFSEEELLRKPLWWKCENGHEWAAKPILQQEEKECPFCAGKRKERKKNKKDYYFLMLDGKHYCFKTLEECKRYVSVETPYQLIKTETYVDTWINLIQPILPARSDKRRGVLACVDGSFSPKTGVVSWAVYFFNRKDAVSFSSAIFDIDKYSSRNLSGEILAAEAAVKIALRSGYKRITLFYDWDVINTSQEKLIFPKNIEIAKYQKEIKELGELIDIRFEKVKSSPNKNKAHLIARDTANLVTKTLLPVKTKNRFLLKDLEKTLIEK